MPPIMGRDTRPGPQYDMARRVAEILGDRWSFDRESLMFARIQHVDGYAIVMEDIGYGLLKVALDLRLEARPCFTANILNRPQDVARRIVEELLPEYERLADTIKQERKEIECWEANVRSLLVQWAPDPAITFDSHTQTVIARWERAADGSAATIEIAPDGSAKLSFNVPGPLIAPLMEAWKKAG